jgi:uncharacterized C2H2 Zn-finger protein
LNGHISSSHTGTMEYKCDICDKAFAYRQSFQVHMKRKHGQQPSLTRLDTWMYICNMFLQPLTHE